MTAKNMSRPAAKDNLVYEDTIVLNGKVGMVEHEDRDHIADYVGVQRYDRIPTFGGYIEKLVSEFAFSPEMEDQLGWRGHAANVRMVFSDEPIDPHAVDEAVIMSYYGGIEREFMVHVSDISGYLWTDEEFKVGGHSIIDILKSHIGEYCHIEMELFRER